MQSIDIKCDTSLYYIEKKLKNLKSQAPSVLAKALNQTAKNARKELQTKAKEEYTVKAGKFNKAMKINNAKKSRLTAVITSEGKPLQLSKFKTRFNKGDAAEAKGLKKHKLKPFVLGGADNEGKDLKGFIAKFSSGHIALVQRVPGKYMKGKEPGTIGEGKRKRVRKKGVQAIKEFYSVSIPKMIGSEENVYGVVEPNIESNLKKNIDLQIAKLLAKSGG